MSPTTILITGANRGIGKGLVEVYLSRPSTTVIAGVRNPSSASALNELPKGQGSSLIIVKIDSESETDPFTAVETLKTKHSIKSLDIVIANAGISEAFYSVAKVPVSVIQKHLMVNGIAPVLLFQAVRPLLQKGSKFALQSSAMGSLSAMVESPDAASYGASKAFANYFTRRIHFENEDIIAFAMDPGFVQTEMGNSGAATIGLKEAFTPTDVCVAGLIKEIDAATREKTSGKFVGWTGTETPW